jgi:hypothetical protein
VPAGEAHLSLLAETLEQYERLLPSLHARTALNEEKAVNPVGILLRRGLAPHARSREVTSGVLLPSLRLL